MAEVLLTRTSLISFGVKAGNHYRCHSVAELAVVAAERSTQTAPDCKTGEIR